MPDVFTSKGKQGNNKTTRFSEKELIEKKRRQLLKMERESQSISVPEGADVHKLPDHNHNPLTSFSFYPDNVRFVNADSQEKIILLVRKHPITNLGWLISAFLMIITPSFVPLLSLFEKLPAGYQMIIFLIWYLLTTAFILEKFLYWYFNVCIITDERVIDVDFVNLLYREISEANIDQIQDVSVEIGGGIKTFFGYGNVLIQTAAEVQKLEFIAIPSPDKVAKILRELGIQEEIEEMEGRIR